MEEERKLQLKNKWLVVLDNAGGNDKNILKSNKIEGKTQLVAHSWTRDVVAMIKSKLNEVELDSLLLVPEERNICDITRNARANRVQRVNKDYTILVSLQAIGWLKDAKKSINVTSNNKSLVSKLKAQAKKISVNVLDDYKSAYINRELSTQKLSNSDFNRTFITVGGFNNDAVCEYMQSLEGMIEISEMIANSIIEAIKKDDK